MLRLSLSAEFSLKGCLDPWCSMKGASWPGAAALWEPEYRACVHTHHPETLKNLSKSCKMVISTAET